MYNNDVINSIKEKLGKSELSRLLPQLSSIAIVELDGCTVEATCAVIGYLVSEGIEKTVVKRVILCGPKSANISHNKSLLKNRFPWLAIERYNKDWQSLKVDSLNLVEQLVVYSGLGDSVLLSYGNGSQRVQNHAAITRPMYSLAIVMDEQYNSDPRSIKCNLELTLKTIKTSSGEEVPAPTSYCLDKQKMMKQCRNKLSPRDYAFQILEDAEQGCEYCNQCHNYNRSQHCPLAQLRVADMYQEGYYVPQDDHIAHQWRLMAAHQGHVGALQLVADDMASGRGCHRDGTAAIKLLMPFARQGDEHFLREIVEIAFADESVNPVLAVSSVALLAKHGDEDMILKLSDAFQEGKMGLPRDMKQQEEWIRVGAENGNPRMVKAMAQMYEANEQWFESYKWYCRLEELDPKLLPAGKLEEIELKWVTDGLTMHEIAVKGMNYLYGYHGEERNLHLANRCLTLASQHDEILATGLLGQMWFHGIGVERSPNKGMELLNKAAASGDLLSMDKLIEINELNNFTTYKERWSAPMIALLDKKTATPNSDVEVAIAHYLKAKYRLEGIFYDKDERAAYESMALAAYQGYPVAQYRLAVMCRDGIGTGANNKKYNKWLKEAAQNGYYEAMGELGVKAYDDWYSDYKDTFKMLKGAIEKGCTNAAALWSLADSYYYGRGTTSDEARAYELYLEAAKGGNMRAQETMCDAYFKGNQWVKKDMSQCVKWGEAAISQGCRSVRFVTAYASSEIGNDDRAAELYLELCDEGVGAAMNNYACMLSDYNEKAEWFKKAADAGDSYGEWNLGMLYMSGNGVEKDFDKGLSLLNKAADDGCVPAMFELARRYRRGDGVKQEGSKVVKWYKKAVDAGDIAALFNLGEVYEAGDVVPQDIDKAIHYFKLAAEQGNVDSLLALGIVYGNLEGAANYQKSIYWYRKAAQGGSQKAKKKLKKMGLDWTDS